MSEPLRCNEECPLFKWDARGEGFCGWCGSRVRDDFSSTAWGCLLTTGMLRTASKRMVAPLVREIERRSHNDSE